MVQNKIIKTKKTEVVKRNENPEFNESFTFKLPLTSLDTANVTITAMQHQSGYKGTNNQGIKPAQCKGGLDNSLLTK